MDRIPPQNLDAERAVLGALLVYPEAFDKVLEILTPDDFYSEAHRLIYQAMLDLENKSTPIDVLTLTDHLKSLAALEKVGGETMVSSLASSVASPVGVEHWAKKIREKAILRKIISESSSIIEEAYSEPEDVEEFLSASEQKFLEVAQERAEKSYMPLDQLVKSGIELLEEYAKRRELITGVASGFDELDKLTSGFQKQELVIIAGRPSTGKSALALNIARNAAIDHDKVVAFFSLEMSREQLLLRLMASTAKVSQSNLRTGFISRNDWDKIIQSADKLHKAPIFIDDSSSLTVLEIKSRARRIKADCKGRLDLVIVDYLQLIAPSSAGKRRNISREQEVSEVSRSLKAMAKELKIPVIALSQLSRAVEHRDDKRPRLADLRESGAIEQDSDVVIFVHRPGQFKKPKGKDEYNPFPSSDEEEESLDALDDKLCELIIGKQRNGPTGIVSLQFFREWALFGSRETRYDKEQIPEIPKRGTE
jgi:replicative DNA helicase